MTPREILLKLRELVDAQFEQGYMTNEEYYQILTYLETQLSTNL